MKKIKTFFKNIKGFFKGFNQLYIAQEDIVYSFYGFGHYHMSKKYADRRYRRNGYLHYVLPAGRGAEQLVVFNSHEMKRLKQLGLMNKRVTIEVLLNEAYYFTKRKR